MNRASSRPHRRSRHGLLWSALQAAALLAAAAIAALAFALPATAGTASFRGVVIAKDSARKSIVAVSRNGVVRTIRARGALKRVRVGRLVAVQAASLPDGTFAASKIRPRGRAGRAHFRATVAALKGARLALSAGGSVFALRVRGGRTGSATGDGFRPGDRIEADALVKGGSLQARREALKRIGHDDQLVLEGIYLAIADDGTIEMAVVHRGRVYVRVPDDVVVPDFQPGDEIVAVVTVADDGSFVLIKAENESSGDDDDGGGGVNGDGTFTVMGVITSLSVDRIFVKVEEHHDPVTCAVLEDFDTGGFAVGQKVLMMCEYDDGYPVLLKLKHHEVSDYLYAQGAITELADESITIQGDGAPVSCAIPEELDLSDFEVGDLVIMYCVKVHDVWTLKAIKHKEDPPPPPPDDVLAYGSIDALTATQITVATDGGPVTCAVPEGADLSAFQIHDDVQVKCVHTDAGLRLKRLQSDSAIWEG
jgi:hypothetical protein